MNAKERLAHFYKHEPFDIMPAAGEGEAFVYPISGFHERPPFGEGGFDWFGCKWENNEQAGAPAPDPSYIVLDDICDWRDKVKFPDLDAWDWDEAARIDGIASIDRNNQLVTITVFHGLWERLHVLMGFEEALCSLIEEPEEVAVFFDAMTDFKIKLLEKLAEYYHADVISFHDDWGTQSAPFFSPEIWRELIKPRQKKIVDACHRLGMIFVQHSCGKYDEIIPDIAEIGVDTLQCMDIMDLKAALDKTGHEMSYLPTIREQEFNSLDVAGLLTEEGVRSMVHEPFMTLGKTGCYMPFLFVPPRAWYYKIVLDEYNKCRQELAGSYGI